MYIPAPREKSVKMKEVERLQKIKEGNEKMAENESESHNDNYTSARNSPDETCEEICQMTENGGKWVTRS